MASKKTITKTPKAPAAPKKEPAKAPKKGPKAAAKPTGPRHPHGRVAEKHGGKAALAKTLASTLARADEDTDALATRLARASNAQLLRLSKATDTLKAKFGGSRDKLIASISAANKKSSDKDYVAKLGTYSLPQLLDLAQ